MLLTIIRRDVGTRDSRARIKMFAVTFTRKLTLYNNAFFSARKMR